MFLSRKSLGGDGNCVFLHGFVVGDGREKANKKSAGYFLLRSVLVLVHREQS